MDVISESKLKVRVQGWLLLCAVLLMGGKFIAFWMTNSISVLTDAMESIASVAAGGVNLYALYVAAKPRDIQHPFGRGKAELISASVEGIMVVTAAVIIFYEGFQRISAPTVPARLDVGILIIALAGAINYLLGVYSIRTGNKHNSMALVAGGKQLQSDTYSTVGLVAGLILLYFTRLPWMDVALGMLFGVIIGWTGISILRRTVGNLLDETDMGVLEEVAAAVNKHRSDDWVDIHDLKMIKYGSSIYIDCSLVVPWYYNVDEATATENKLKSAIKHGVEQYIMLSVHVDPCDEKYCSRCPKKECVHRRETLVSVIKFDVKELGKVSGRNRVSSSVSDVKRPK